MAREDRPASSWPSDLSLGGKRVVLKVSLDRGQEPKTQGALDHPHIVPVNSVAFQPERGLRGLSMPLPPGLPLDEIIKRVRPADRLARPGRSGKSWCRAAQPERPLTAGGTRQSSSASGPVGDGWNGFPLRGTYAQGVAWIGMILARTLHYAHGMQTFHRDVKPGNILITIHHGPQLLDFNLAESPHAAQHAESAMLGGTLPYMAPEQIEAFLNPDLWGNVGARADLYSLGLVLRELLTGQAPDLPDDKLPPPGPCATCSIAVPALPIDVRLRPVPHVGRHRAAVSVFRPRRTLPRRPGAGRRSREFPQTQAPAACPQPVSVRADGELDRPQWESSRRFGPHDRAGHGPWHPGLSSSGTLKPPVEVALREAVDDINHGLVDSAIRKLEKLLLSIPRAPPPIYLSRAHIQRPQLPSQALRLLRRCWNHPAVTRREFVARDPHVVNHLRRWVHLDG